MPLPAQFAIVIGLSLALLPAVCAEQPSGLELKPHWKVGEKLRYEMIRAQSRDTNGKVVRGGSRAPVDVEVIAAGEAGFVVRWRLGETVSDDPKAANNPVFQAMTKLTAGMKVDLEISPDGRLLGIENWKELQKTGKQIQETVLEELAEGNLPKTAIEALRAETDKLFANRESVEASFTRHPALLVIPLGQTYDKANPAISEVDLANPFGGEPIPAVGEFLLKSHDSETGLATVTFTQKPDPKKLKRVLEKSLRDLAKRLGKNMDGVTLPAFDMTDEAEYAVETKTGWVRRVVHTRRTQTGTSVATETTTLTRRDQK